MTDTSTKTANRPNIRTGYRGTFKEGSMTSEMSGETRVVTAILVTEGENPVEKTIRGRGKNAELLEAAVEQGGVQIVQGEIYGAKNAYLSVLSVGPEVFSGKLTKIRTNLGTDHDGKMAYVDAFLTDRGEGPKGNRIPGFPVKFFGDDAEALAGLEEGSRVSFEGYSSMRRVTNRDGEALQDENGKDRYRTEITVTGAVALEPALEEDAAPSM